MTTTWKGIVDWPNGAATLNAAIDDTTETIVLSADPGATMSASDFYVRIGFEQIYVATRAGATLTCTGGRGANGTAAAAHLAGDAVAQDFFAAHVTAIRDAINDLEDGSTAAGAAATVTNADDTTTNATMYPVWVTTVAGNRALYVSSTKLTFNPSIGALTVTRLVSTSLACDTTTLVVDSVNHRVGIGTASPSRPFVLNAGSAAVAVLFTSTAPSVYFDINSGHETGQAVIRFLRGDAAKWIYGNDGADSDTFKMGTLSTLGSGIKLWLTSAGNLTTYGTGTFNGGTVTAGVAATTRGQFVARSGSGGAAPGTLTLMSKNGTQYNFFVTDAGVFRVLTGATLPTADTDGSAV